MDLQGSRRRGGRYRVVGIFPLVAEHSGSGGRANQCRGGQPAEFQCLFRVDCYVNKPELPTRNLLAGSDACHGHNGENRGVIYFQLHGHGATHAS
jgi:hypothetical protein